MLILEEPQLLILKGRWYSLQVEHHWVRKSSNEVWISSNYLSVGLSESEWVLTQPHHSLDSSERTCMKLKSRNEGVCSKGKLEQLKSTCNKYGRKGKGWKCQALTTYHILWRLGYIQTMVKLMTRAWILCICQVISLKRKCSEIKLKFIS